MNKKVIPITMLIAVLCITSLLVSAESTGLYTYFNTEKQSDLPHSNLQKVKTQNQERKETTINTIDTNSLEKYILIKGLWGFGQATNTAVSSSFIGEFTTRYTPTSIDATLYDQENKKIGKIVLKLSPTTSSRVESQFTGKIILDLRPETNIEMTIKGTIQFSQQIVYIQWDEINSYTELSPSLHEQNAVNQNIRGRSGWLYGTIIEA